ncbi:ABC transporter permease [Agathobaculum sp. NTUH-O15-33]|uniref:ABC transporter permease n=1 Tax=Agathobaculum sp. NTUH-O15-33 TaxID=3079302 RepID=UPI002958A698|nr:ABC transporter permease [Agathobaculum sp. NTUH-O15-33]WNX85156.1 ABC transporter permease [Agathobaculum sp. NTUH-O15-33]
MKSSIKKIRMRENDEALPLKKICVGILIGYLLLTVCFYFLSGEQLHYRNSRGNIEMQTANAATIELTTGSTVEQRFHTNIQIIDNISVQWGSFNRVNQGTVIVQLLDAETQKLLLDEVLQANELTEGKVTDFTLPALEGYFGKTMLLRIFSPNSTPGNAVTPLMKSDGALEQGQLLINGEPVSGVLSFSISGRDYIWSGLHYWEFVFGGWLFLLLFDFIILYKQKKGRKSLLVNALIAVRRYRFLIRQLVSRDFKTKYKRSVLGILWSFLNPLLTMSVQYMVFSNIFRMNIENYPAYLLCGGVMFNFFSEACGMTLGSITGNSTLITKVYMPKYIYPLTRTLSSAVNLLISMIPLFLVVLFSGIMPTKAYLLLPFELICLIVFCLGLGMLLSASMVFFRDTQFLWGVLSMIWMYMTPIFYPESILPPGMDIVLKINPLYYFIKFTRICVIDGISPEPMLYVQSALFAVGMLVVGACVFKKTQDKFILYL